MEKRCVLWVDDECEDLYGSFIELLSKDYDVLTAVNSTDGMEIFQSRHIDAVILDNIMPQSPKQGVEMLADLKKLKPSVPVIMLSNDVSEQTNDTAFNNMADDFLYKPVKVPQLKSKLRFLFDGQERKEDKMRSECNKLFVELSSQIGSCSSFADWAELYNRIVKAEVEAEAENINEVAGMFAQLRRDANSTFAKTVVDQYVGWLAKPDASAPEVFSHQVLSKIVKPMLQNGEKVGLVVIDNFRLDQWLIFQKELEKDDKFDIKTDLYCSILPTATQYSRNAIFAGLLPSKIKEISPDKWVDTASSEDGLNEHEREFLADYFTRQRLTKENSYYKVGSNESGREYLKKFGGYKKNDINALVFNSIDQLSHKSSERGVNKDLLSTDEGYRALTLTWLKTGVLKDILYKLADNGYRIVLTTDHGTIRVSNPVDVTGSQDINSNMRYKVDKNLQILKKSDVKKVLEVSKPETIGLPKSNVSDRFIFATNEDYFVYPNNRNEFAGKFDESFQHGGISMEEMILPLVTLTKR